MKTAISKDGTHIAYDVYGEGQPVIMVGGMMNSRVFAPAPGAEQLGKYFAVYDYDRRGRGDSEDNQPYTPRKEVEDIAALIEVAGGRAALCGFSAGCAVAVEAAIELGPEKVTKLAMYEGPFTADPLVLKEWQDYGKTLQQAVNSGNDDEMVIAFLSLVHAEDQVEKLRRDKATWQKLCKLAPTLMYDYKVITSSKQIPQERLAEIKVPTLVVCGGDSGVSIAADTERIAHLILHGTSKVLPGQSHSVEPGAIVPVLQEFFSPANSHVSV